MARRIRSIKPEILDDEKTAFLSHLEYRLFVGSWIVADDYGNLRGDPDYLRGQIVWASRESRETVAKALESLERVALLTPYSVRGQTYYHVTTWDKHQRIDKPGKPGMPGPEQSDSPVVVITSDDSRESRESSGNPRESLAPDTDQDQDQEGEREQEIPPPASKRSTKKLLVDGWVPERSDANQRAEQAAKDRGVDLRVELAKLRDWAKATAGRRADWEATWRNWTRNARPESRRPGQQSTPLELQREKIARMEREQAEREASQ